MRKQHSRWGKKGVALKGIIRSLGLTCTTIVVKSISCVWLCDPLDCSTSSLSVLHYLLEFAQTHVHWVGDAIQPSHPLLSPSLPTFNLSQQQGLFQWVSSSQYVAQRGHSAGRKFRAECSVSIGVPGIKVSLNCGVTLSFSPGFIAIVLSNKVSCLHSL